MNELIYEQALVIPVIGGEVGSVSANVIDNLESFSTTDALSANQGRVLNEKIINVANRVAPILGESGEVVETKDEYLMRVPTSLRYVGMSVVLKGGNRYEFQGGIQDKNLLKVEAPTGGGGGSVDVIDNLSSTAKDKALSANQGRILNDTKLDTKSFQAHQQDINNPHNVTAAQVGLGSVDNTSDIDKPISSATQIALDGKLNKTVWDDIFELVEGGIRVKGNLLANGDVVAYTDAGIEGGGGAGGGLISKVWSESELNKEFLIESLTETFSAKAIKSIYDRAVSNAENLNSHIGNKSNPHGVTAEQIGAAEASHTHSIVQVVDLQKALDGKASASDLSSHVGNKENPHKVTKSQVGLGNVDDTSDINKPISSATQVALDGKLNKTIWDGIFELVEGGIRVKGNLLANGDVVAYTKDGIEGGGGSGGGLISKVWSESELSKEFLVESLTETFSAKAVKSIYDRTVSNAENLNSHIGNKNNPHGVTVSQIGALGANEASSDSNKLGGIAPQDYARFDRDAKDLDTALPSGSNIGLFTTKYRPSGTTLPSGNYIGGLNIRHTTNETERFSNQLCFVAGREIPYVRTSNASGVFGSWREVWYEGNFDPATKADKSLLDSHVDSKSNPHGVTTSQIGAATSSDLNAHTGNISNPHSVTAEQVGAPSLSEYNSHKGNTDNPHKVTKSQVGLGNVDDTSDINKPISNAAQAALDKKLDKSIWDGIFELVEGGIKVKGNLLANGDVVAFTNSVIEGGGGSGGGLITRVYGIEDLGADIGTESLTETFSAKAIQDIYNRAVSTSTDLLNHKGDRSNPHGVTPSQIGALGKTEKAADSVECDTARTASGNYTGKGGQQQPSYVGRNRVRFNMMNTVINGNTSFKDFILMDCYSGNDVGGAVAFGVNRSALGAYIMRSDASRESWNQTAELWGTHNFDPTTKADKNGDFLQEFSSAKLLLSNFGIDSSIGSLNNGHLHYNTTAGSHWFNTDVRVAGEIFAGPEYNKKVWHEGNFDPNSKLGKTETAYNSDRLGNTEHHRYWMRGRGSVGVDHEQYAESGSYIDTTNTSWTGAQWVFGSYGSTSGLVFRNQGGGHKDLQFRYSTDGSRWDGDFRVVKDNYNTYLNRRNPSKSQSSPMWHLLGTTINNHYNGFTAIVTGMGVASAGMACTYYISAHSVSGIQVRRIGSGNYSQLEFGYVENGYIKQVWVRSKSSEFATTTVTEEHTAGGAVVWTNIDGSAPVSSGVTSINVSTVYDSLNCNDTSTNWTCSNLTASNGVYIPYGKAIVDSSHNRNIVHTGWSDQYGDFCQLSTTGLASIIHSLLIGSNGKVKFSGGAVSIGCDNWGSMTLAMGDSDTGFNWLGDGHLSGYANGVRCFHWTAGGFYLDKDLTSEMSSSFKGNVVADAGGAGHCFHRPAIAGYAWNNGNGAFTVDVRDNGNQTPLFLARREGSDSAGVNRLFSIEQLNTGNWVYFLQAGDVFMRAQKGGFLFFDKPIDVTGDTVVIGTNNYGTVDSPLWNQLAFRGHYGGYYATIRSIEMSGTSGEGKLEFLVRPKAGGSTVDPSLVLSLDSDRNAMFESNVRAKGEIVAYSTSDKRFKNDVKKLENCTDFIDKLNPVSYHWNEEAKELMPHKTDDIDFGLIAQELEEVQPELVHTVFDKYKSIDYVKLVPFLIGAIKELNAKIKDLCQ